MKIGLDVAQHQLTWPEFLERVRFAEELGFTSAWVFDHFEPLYGDPAGPCLEAYSLLAALGTATERIRLGALVTGVTYRHPSVLAAQAITIDHVSGGRLDLGIGAAWHEPEHRALGIDFPPSGDRIDRLAEALRVIEALMTEDDATVGGDHYRLEHASYRPRPVQQPHPPIWIGAMGERRMLPLAARHADVWHAFGDRADLVRKSSLLDRHAEEAGRDPASIGRATSISLDPAPDDVRREVDIWQDAGFSHLVASWPTAGYRQVEAFARAVLPALDDG